MLESLSLCFSIYCISSLCCSAVPAFSGLWVRWFFRRHPLREPRSRARVIEHVARTPDL
ncbi:hypothetical protein EMGBS3_01950 [Anaerolineaceae bacterium]|nr:hypothetical protein EMGBS3_01950 [Anaerolineaceae bacterium]GBL37539.1 hypothetical protein EMGBD1_12260 [Anaerolineaceae bacterium]